MARLRAALSVPSVTRNEEIESRVVSVPLMRPTSAPVAIPASAPTNQKLADPDGVGRRHARKRQRRCNRQVNLARDDHEGHADRDDRHHRRLPADVQKIVDRQTMEKRN